MYKDFYELTRTPFDITPDPSSFFPSPGHKEALANLSYGVVWRKGFTVLTGEVGTGKTLLLSCLLDLLKNVQVAFGYIVNTRLTPGEFLRYMVHDLQVPTQAKDKSELLLDFNKYLIERHQRGSTTALVVDEAHALELDVLEEIRFLGNLETAREKLLQIVLVGQPELDTKLDSTELRQLKQRIMLRCKLEPLRHAETRPYIERRLLAAGAKPDRVSFPDRTVELIYLYSNGIPRVINTICENALVIGCAQRSRVIIPSVIEEVAADFHLHRSAGISANTARGSELFGGPETVNRTSTFTVNS
jgi:general secretion pathway protein A